MKLEIKSVSKKYKNKEVLSDVNLVLESGVYGLVGPNGAGKTTLINIIATVLQATSGQILVENQTIEDISVYRGKIGYLPQSMDFYDNFTAVDFLKYMCLLKEYVCENVDEYAEELLKKVNLFEQRNNLIRTFSGGMKQRLGIAQAVIGKPELLLLDEPTVGLDINERKSFKEMVKSLGKESIVILSTHIISDVEETADKIIFMNKGKIVSIGSKEFYDKFVFENELDSLEDAFKVICGGDLNA